MLQRNDYDFRNQRKILVLEMFEILGAQTLTKILLHCVIDPTVLGLRPFDQMTWLNMNVFFLADESVCKVCFQL